MKGKIKLFLDAEGRVSGIKLPRSEAIIKSADGSIEFKGDSEDVAIILDVLKTSFFSGIKESLYKILDKGTIVRNGANVTNAAAVLYTVPANKVFYWLHYDLDVHQVAALADVMGNIALIDPTAVSYAVADINFIVNTVYHDHTSGNFSFIRLTRGWYIQVESTTANANAVGNIIGVEVDAP